MTTKVVTDDQKVNRRPTSEQVDTYTRRENELRQRYLKGVLDFDEVLAGIQALMERKRVFIDCNVQPEIPDWAAIENPIIYHFPCGVMEASKFTTASVFEEGDYLDGEEYIRRARKLPGAANACAFDFYTKSENWKYLPKDAEVVVFPSTVFRNSYGHRCVRYLCRYGVEWYRHSHWLDYRFDRRYRVACSQVSA